MIGPPLLSCQGFDRCSECLVVLPEDLGVLLCEESFAKSRKAVFKRGVGENRSKGGAVLARAVLLVCLEAVVRICIVICALQNILLGTSQGSHDQVDTNCVE